MSKLLPAALALSLLATPVLAQGTAITPGQSVTNAQGTASPTPPPASGTKASPSGKAAKSAKSKDCSMQADQQGLHGKARKQFRSKCKAGKT